MASAADPPRGSACGLAIFFLMLAVLTTLIAVLTRHKHHFALAQVPVGIVE